jgi:hypothetical protein
MEPPQAAEIDAEPAVGLDELMERIGLLAESLDEVSVRQSNALNLTDPITFAELSRRIGRDVLAELRNELLIDRERAGLLTDLR